MDTTNKVIGFGGEAANNPTPKAIKLIYRLTGLAGSLFAAFTVAFPTVISTHAQLVSLQAISFGTLAIYLICQQFGWVLPKKDNGQA